MTKAVIVAAKRTPIGVYGGQLQKWEPEHLLKPLFEHFEATLSCSLNDLDDVILGNIVGKGGNIARKSLLEAGIDVSVPGLTVDRQCGSGLEAIHLASRLVESGAGDFYIAGVSKVRVVHLGKWKSRHHCIQRHLRHFMSVRHLRQ